MQWLTLEGGAQVFIDSPEKKGVCKSCKAEFIWGVTKKNKWMPIVKNGDKYTSHFSNCPGSKNFRKDKVK